jgi:hypothetical protein
VRHAQTLAAAPNYSPSVAQQRMKRRGWMPRGNGVTVRRRPAGRAARTTTGRDHPNAG